MNSEEQAQAVSELEERVERLRALYEQYFIGIEKIEPMVQRKEVDRRLWVLRREQIRNTGLRFKLQQVVSRYNTFGMYWQRILREIENGTYKRDVARAAKRFGTEALTIAAKRRLGRRGRGADQPEDEAPPSSVAGAAAARGSMLPEDASQTIPDAGPPVSTPVPLAPPRSKPKAAPISLDLDEDDDLFAGLDMRGSGPDSSASRPASSTSSVPRPTSAPLSTPRPPLPSPAGLAFTPRAPSAPTPLPRPDSAPVSRPQSAPLPRPLPAPAVAPRAPTPPSPIAPSPVAAAPVAAAPVAAPPVRPVAAQPAVPSPMVRSGLASSGNPFAARPAAGEAPTRPSAQVVPARPAAAPAPVRAAREEGDLPEARMREIYGKYVDAKRQCNESTASITSDSLAKSLRDSANKLRQKHAGKQVDFDVVIKDGKAVLKPVLKG